MQVMNHYILIVIVIIIIWSQLCKAGREWEHSVQSPKTPTPQSPKTQSVQRPQPHTTNPQKEEKDKTVGIKKERADHANRKALALLLKPASPTPSNIRSLRSFQRDTERGTKFLRYWEVLQRGGANECLWTTKEPRVTRAGHTAKAMHRSKDALGYWQRNSESPYSSSKLTRHPGLFCTS